MTSPVPAIPSSNDFLARCGKSALRCALAKGQPSHIKPGPFAQIAQSALQHLLLIGRGSKFVSRIAAVFRANEGQYFPKVVGALDDGAERRHGADDVFMTLAHITLFLKFVAAQRDESK